MNGGFSDQLTEHGVSRCCHLTGAGLSSLKGQAPKSYRQLSVQMAELQDSQLKTTAVMSLFVISFLKLNGRFR